MKTLNRIIKMAGLAAVTILPMAVSAATFYVSPDGDDDNAGTSAKPFATIQKALDSVNTWGDSIQISNGTYMIESELVLSVAGITIRSFSGNPSDVIIDADGDCRCFNGSASFNHYFRGITFINGKVTGNGGGVLTGNNSTFDDCVFRNCSATSQGGAVYVSNLKRMTNVRFEGCSAGTNGGGFYGAAFTSDCYISGVTVDNCTAGSNGGGIYIAASLTGSDGISNCRIYNCSAGNRGGGVYINGTTLSTVSDCDISCNTASDGGGGIFGKYAAIRNCTVTNNVCNATSGTTGGSGIRLLDYGTIEGCLIKGNSFANDCSSFNSGGSAVWLVSGASLVNSAIIGNSGARSVGMQWTNCGGVLVSNCLFKSNVARLTGEFGWGGTLYLYGLNNADSLITDCRFLDNQAASAGGVVGMNLNSGSKNSTLRIRNCLISGNVQTAGTGCVLANSGTGATANRLALENCTIVSNTISGSPVICPYVANASYTSRDFVSVSGCAILFNNGKVAFDDTFKLSANVTTNCTEMRVISESNITYDSSKPLFEDLANGNFRPARNSQLCDLVPKAAWMGDGSQNSTSRDLGTGYELQTAGTYGVNVVWTDSVPRLYKDRADIGCFEFYLPPTPPGLVIIFK